MINNRVLLNIQNHVRKNWYVLTMTKTEMFIAVKFHKRNSRSSLFILKRNLSIELLYCNTVFTIWKIKVKEDLFELVD